MSCVNIKSKEFKSLVKNLDYSEAAVEMAVHEIINKEGYKGNFPSASEIVYRLSPKAFEDSSDLNYLWENEYATPKRFNYEDYAYEYYDKAVSLFGENSVRINELKNGDYEVSVGCPKSLNIDNINSGIFYELKRRNERSPLGPRGELFNKILDVIDKRYLPDVVLEPSERKIKVFGKETTAVMDANSFKIRVFLHEVSKENNKPFLKKNFMHECLHVTTLAAIDRVLNHKGTAEEKAFYLEMRRLYNIASKTLGEEATKYYGMSNIKEFISEIGTNVTFQKRLSSIKDPKTKKGVFNSIVEAFTKFFNKLGINISNSITESALMELSNFHSYLEEVTLDKNALRELIQREVKTPSDITEIENNLSKLESEYNDLYDSYLNDKISEAEFLEKRNNLYKQEGILTVIKGLQELKEKNQSLYNAVVEGKSSFYKAYNLLSAEEARENKVSEDTYIPETKLKSEYKGKIILAPKGSGKTTIADNINVFDSDFLLGQVLGVSTETANFFFNTLSAIQKEAFNKEFKNLVAQKKAEGKTILTSDPSLEKEADIVVTSPQSSEDNNRKNQKGERKEDIKIGENKYLGDYLLRNPEEFNSLKLNKSAEESAKAEIIDRFLKAFNLTLNNLNFYNNSLPLFDALNRAINATSQEDITDAVGYAIAFMMQGEQDMLHIINMYYGSDSKHTNNIKQALQIGRQEVIESIGKQIAKELRNHFGEPLTSIRPNKSNKSIWSIIKNFFGRIARSILKLGKEERIERERQIFVSDIIESLSRQDFSRIKGVQIKQGSNEKAHIIDINKAFAEHPYEVNIIKKLNSVGIALAGSTSIAAEGTLFRPSENPLHDIDFSAGNITSRKQLDTTLKSIFNEDEIAFTSRIKKLHGSTITYVTLNTPFIVKNRRGGRKIYEEYYSKDGKTLLGVRDGSDLNLSKGVEGKLLDFFIGKDVKKASKEYYNREINGETYLLAPSKFAWEAKVNWARPKDIWDYKHFNNYLNKDEYAGLETYLSPSISEDTTSETINIYAGTNENADLSNFAKRPFTVKGTVIGEGTSADFSFPTVEHAFQAAKVSYADIPNRAEWVERIKTARTPAEARKLGKQIPKLNSKEWDLYSSEIMKDLLKASFKQNPQALQRLLATGNATLTHTQDKSKWRTEFPKLLMEVREELQQENKKSEIPSTETSINNQNQQVSKETQEFLDHQQKLGKQIDKLLDSNELTSTMANEIAADMMFTISDCITELQQDKELAVKRFGKAFEGKDFTKMSRYEIAKTIGVSNLLNYVKAFFMPQNNKAIAEDFELMDLADVIREECWEALLLKGQNLLSTLEGFTIAEVEPNKKEIIENIDTTNPDEMSYDEDTENIHENEGSEQEHYQITEKTRDVISKMSQKVKVRLMSYYQMESPTKKVISKFGMNKRINVQTAINSILRWGQGALTLSKLVEKLKEQEANNPWVSQLIRDLTDDSGNMTDFQSQFFGALQQHFQYYTIVTYDIDKETGKRVYKSIPVNERPALAEAVKQVSIEYNIGEHPLFDTEGKVKEEAWKELDETIKELDKLVPLKKEDNTRGEISKENEEDVAKNIGYLSNLLGYHIVPDIVKKNLNTTTYWSIREAIGRIRKSLENNIGADGYEPFKFRAKDNILGNVEKFLSPITESLEDETISSVFSDGKLYQSYTTPSYLSKLFLKFHLEEEEFKNFIENEYANQDWFHIGNNLDTGWVDGWLSMLVHNSEAREVFKHKVQLSFNKKTYMKKMDDLDFLIATLTEYWSERNPENTSSTFKAWFPMPIQSNKPSSEYIRFYAYEGPKYKETITNGLYTIFLNEIKRIKTVQMRNKKKGDSGYIENWDGKRGRQFCFISWMNDYLSGSKKSSELGKLLQSKLNNEEINENKLSELVKKATQEYVDAQATSMVEEIKKQKLLPIIKQTTNIGTEDAVIEEGIRNFYWNNLYASMNILQLTIGDTAFYKNAEDLQKRLAQLHAPGIRGNIEATTYEGGDHFVSDGFERTIYLTDFEDFKSNIIENISLVLDKKINEARTVGKETEAKAFENYKEMLVGEDGAYRKINVADAQAYNSITSYRKKAFIFGKWNKVAEELYQKLRSGNYTAEDIGKLAAAFQPLKPFVYSRITKSTGVPNAPLKNIGVAVQNKNSEYLLILADALLRGENTGKPNLLRAIYEIMEESHYDEDGNYKKDGIDTVQFESTVKSGKITPIDIKKYVNLENGEAIAKNVLHQCIYERGTGKYNEDYVHAIPFEDYCLQQEVPAHFKDHNQVEGSQLRYLIPSELVSTLPNGEDALYDIEGNKYTAEEFKKEYEKVHAQNINESLNNIIELFKLNNPSKIERNASISKLLQREILSNPRYGMDLLQACMIDENGDFRIPKGDPTQSKRIEQLLNSIIKKEVNNQKMAGGPVVQVSSFGISRQLNIVFKDKDGKYLLTKKEWEKEKKNFENSKVFTPIKEEFKGKLIFAQSGIGKSSIADNVNVFDSDYLLAQILGVDTPLATAAFNLLSPSEKIQVSKKYDEKIKEKIREGKTVVTARVNSLQDADYAIYFNNPEDADSRTSDDFRSNQYSNLEYQKETLEKITKARETSKAKFIGVDKNTYLSNIILEDPSFNIYHERTKEFKNVSQALKSFMKEFGFTFEELAEKGYTIDKLEKVIKAFDEGDISDASGEMIAYMMQYNAKCKQLIVDLAQEEGIEPKYNTDGTINSDFYKELDKDKYIKIIGKSISDEVRRQFKNIKEGKGFSKDKPSSFIQKIRDLISDFLNLITKNEKLIEDISSFAKYVSSNILQGNTSIIKGSILKPGDEGSGKVEKVDLRKALDKYEYESGIIENLSKVGISLAGSAAMSTQVSVFRPVENPLHDLDFNTYGNINREQLEEKIKPLFPNLEHIRTIKNDSNVTETYLTFNTPFEVQESENGMAIYLVKSKKTGKVIATFVGSNLTITEEGKKENVQGKFLDFFTQKDSKYAPIKFRHRGKTYLVGNYKDAIEAKLEWTRLKDLFDYNRAVKNELLKKSAMEYNSYEDYIQENQAGIAHYEVFAPIFNDDIMRKFADKDGNIDIKTLELINPDLLKMIGYRIPTEAKYSVAPLKIVGFLPREAGEAIMLPEDITTINGSDFDVDKEYLIRKEIQILTRFIPRENESMPEAERKYVRERRDEVVNHLINALQLKGRASKEEIKNIEDEIKANIYLEKSRENRKHEDNLEKIKERDTRIIEAINSTKTKEQLKKGENNSGILKNETEREKKLNYHKKEVERWINSENKRHKRVLDTINIKESEVNKLLLKEVENFERNKAKERVIRFLEKDVRKDSSKDDRLTSDLRKAYISYIYKTAEPTSGRIYRNNKIFDMMYEVLTSEGAAFEMLSPGGFEDLKKQGYSVEAARVLNKDVKEMEKLSIDALKDIIQTDKNISLFNVHKQFYKQNAAAASLIGIFAVNRISHAVLENEGYLIDVDAACKKSLPTKGLNIAGTIYKGLVELDPRVNEEGESVGRLLANTVSSSVDAVKDPILQLLNISPITVNFYTTLIRTGMGSRKAALFLSQSAITDIVNKYQADKFSFNTSLIKTIQNRIKELENKFGIKEGNKILEEGITLEELEKGINSTNINTEYKVLKALLVINDLANAMQLPNLATRFNSVSSAVGPLAVDNLLMEFKMEKVSEESYILDKNGESVDIFDIMEKHPILDSFHNSYQLAREILFDSPAYDPQLSQIINEIEGTFLGNKLRTNKEILNKFIDFYQTALLVNAGVPTHSLKYIIEEFPKEFVHKKYKEKYRDNPLISAIKLGKDSKGRLTLEVKTTGMGIEEKERLSSAWTDLHKINPELSQLFFEYNLYRGGIGFTPKTFMHLISTYVKEKIPGYKATLSNTPVIDHNLVVDYFIRNNWRDDSIVPKIKNKNIVITDANKTITAYQEDKIKELSDYQYIKLTINEAGTFLYKQTMKGSNKIEFKQIEPFGGNKDYVEIYAEQGVPALDASVESNILEEDNILPEQDEQSQEEYQQDGYEDIEAKTKEQKQLDDLLLTLWSQNMPQSKAYEIIQKWKGTSTEETNKHKDFLKNFIKERLLKHDPNADLKLIEDLYNRLNLC